MVEKNQKYACGLERGWPSVVVETNGENMEVESSVKSVRVVVLMGMEL